MMISREQVEKVWRGEWQKYRLNLLICSKCGVFGPNLMKNFRFCPVCGAPMTDEAVEMVMERMDKCVNLT